jgi:hypothetical protein
MLMVASEPTHTYDEYELTQEHAVGRKIDIDQLVGAVEIADRLGVARPQVVHDWRRRHEDFPAPVAVISRVGLWYWPEVERWARATGRL